MSTTPTLGAPHDELRDEVRKQANEFATLAIEPLLKKDVAGGIYNLEEGRSYLETIIRIATALEAADLRNAGESTLRSLLNYFNSIRNQIQAVRNFNPTQSSNPIGERNGLTSALRNVADEAVNNIGHIIAICNVSKSSSYEERAESAIQTLQQIVADGMKSAAAELEKQKKTQSEIEAVLEAAKKAAQSVGIVEHSRFFQLESQGHLKAAKIWLGATIVLTMLAIGVGWWNYSHTVDALTSAISKAQQSERSQGSTKPDNSEFGTTALQIQLAVAKLIIFSVLFSAVVWTGKIYRAHRHNYVINRHRLNALSTFEAFAKATDDQQIKNAVLLQATQCIFGPQPTGYISSENENEGYPQILEIVRGIGSGDKGK
jgi:hypothetical protein